MPAKGQFKYSKKEALDMIKTFYKNNNRFPKNNEFNSKHNLPSKNYYFNHFDSMLVIADLCEIKLSEDEIKLYSKRVQTNEEILKKVKEYTVEFIKNNSHLPRKNDLDKIVPSAILSRRFKTMENMYSLIGIDYSEVNERLLKEDMINKYMQLYDLLGYTPNSREIDLYSKTGDCYAMKTYSQHFGSLYDLQILCNLTPTKMGINRTKDEMLSDLQQLINNLGRLPTVHEVTSCDDCCCLMYYNNMFGSLYDAFLELGYKKKDINRKIYITKNGVACNSSYEHKFATMLEKNHIEYQNEILYSSIIPNFKRRYRFDFIINIENITYCVEIFGIEGSKKYDERRNEKINLCKDNNIKLIDLYKEDILKGSYDYLYEVLFNKINNLKVA